MIGFLYAGPCVARVCGVAGMTTDAQQAKKSKRCRSCFTSAPLLASIVAAGAQAWRHLWGLRLDPVAGVWDCFWLWKKNYKKGDQTCALELYDQVKQRNDKTTNQQKKGRVAFFLFVRLTVVRSGRPVTIRQLGFLGFLAFSPPGKRRNGKKP